MNDCPDPATDKCSATATMEMTLDDSVSNVLKEMGSSMTVERARCILKYILSNPEMLMLVEKAMASEAAKNVISESIGTTQMVRKEFADTLSTHLENNKPDTLPEIKNKSCSLSRETIAIGIDRSEKTESGCEKECKASRSQLEFESFKTAHENLDDDDDVGLPDPASFFDDPAADEETDCKSKKLKSSPTNNDISIPLLDFKVSKESLPPPWESSKRKSHSLPDSPIKQSKISKPSNDKSPSQKKGDAPDCSSSYKCLELEKTIREDEFLKEQEVVDESVSCSAKISHNRGLESEVKKNTSEDMEVCAEDKSSEIYGEVPVKVVETPGKNLDFCVLDDSNSSDVVEPAIETRVSICTKTNVIDGEAKSLRQKSVECREPKPSELKSELDSKTIEHSNKVQKVKKKTIHDPTPKAKAASRRRSSPQEERQWTREQDREILLVCQRLGSTDEAFKVASKNLGIKRFQVVKRRFAVLMEVVQKVLQKEAS